MSLLDTTITLTGVQLVRILRDYSSARCDAVGLTTSSDWDEAIESRLWQTDEGAWLECLASKELRASFVSLCGAKEFADDLLADAPTASTSQ